MAPLNFTLLGTFNIEEDGQPSQLLHSSRGCALLAYLIVSQRPQRRETVADLLWESTSTSQSLTRLRVLLSRLRTLLPPDLVVSRQVLSFVPGETSFVDLYALHNGLTSDDPAALDATLQLYQGDLLAGFYVDDAPRFNEWLLLEREPLRQQVLSAYRRLCAAYAAAEAWAAGETAAQRWLGLDDLDEEAVRWLMRLRAGQGQIAAGLLAYEALRQHLWQELGVAPESVTADLAQHLQAEAEARSWSDVVTIEPWQPPPLPDPDTLSPPGLLPPSSYLPYRRNDDFHGRTESLQQLARHLLPWPATEGELPRAVAITGMGGLGKTQLAVEFAYRYGRYFAGGVYWLNFGHRGDVAGEVARVGGERGLRLYQADAQLTQKEQVERVQRVWQEAVPRLLIFDNCEEEALLNAWLPVTGGCRVLLTSRRGSWSRGLRLLAVPLPLLAPDEGTTLLRQIVPRIDEREAAEIAAEVGHLPLALLLAAGFLRRYRQVTPADYLHQLRDQGLLAHPSLRGRGSELSPTGHALSMARTFALSLEQLDPDDEVDAVARQLLARAASFAPSIPLAQDLLLETVVADQDDTLALLTAEDGLARLLALGFLQATGQRHAVMHELLVAFTREACGDDATAVTAVEAAVYRRLHRQNQESSSLFSLPLAPAHVRFLVERALRRGDVAAADLAYLYGIHLNLVANFDASETFLQRGAAIYETVYGPDHPETAKYLTGLGILYNRSGHYWKARAIYERVLTIREEKLALADKPTADALNNLGYQLIQQGDYDSARPYLERALAIELSDPDHPRAATVWTNLGTIALASGAYEEASDCLTRSLEIRERALGPDHPYAALSLQHLGTLHRHRHAFAEAQACLDRALAIRKQALGEAHPHTARSLTALGELALARGDYAAAQAHLEQAQKILESLFPDDHPEMGLTYRDLGDLYLARGNEEMARHHFRRAIAILEQHVLPGHTDLRHARQRLQELERER